MAGTSLPLLPPQRSWGKTARRDRWWITPALIFGGLSMFIVYATWSAFQGAYYWLPGTNYLSPFYSPEIWGTSPHNWFGAFPSWWPGWLPQSPALLILAVPAGFRFTCYYYRGAYYKAFWADPPACAVGEPRKGYIGENGWPLRIQNIHRYFMYLAVLFIFLLAIDAIKAFWFQDLKTGKWGFGIGVGTIIMCVNVVLLAGYTFGCHSLRHIVGGRKDCLTESPTCHAMYKGCTALNKKHMLWAWMSLFSVLLTDIYIRGCAMELWKDIQII